MSSQLTLFQIGVLLVQFSTAPDPEKPQFLRQHPELLSASVVGWALTAARLRSRMGEPEAGLRLARAALDIATAMGDRERQDLAREMLRDEGDQGHEHITPLMGDTDDAVSDAQRHAAQSSSDPLPAVDLDSQRQRSHKSPIPTVVERPSFVTVFGGLLRAPGRLARSLLVRRMAGGLVTPHMHVAGPGRPGEPAQRAGSESGDRSPEPLAAPAMLSERLVSPSDNTISMKISDLLSAIAAASSEQEARRIVRERIGLAREDDFLPCLMHLRDRYHQLPDASQRIEAACALILDEVNRALAEMAPDMVGHAGICTALMLADNPQALEAAISRYRPLLDDGFFTEFEHMRESFSTYGLPEFVAQARMREHRIRQQLAVPAEEPTTADIDPQMLALLRVSQASDEEEAWSVVADEPGLLSEAAIQPILAMAAFRAAQGYLDSADRLR